MFQSQRLFRMKGERGNNAVILPVSIAAKPLLTEEHKSQRVFYCCENVNFVDSTFNDCFSSIHIDEKWFFISGEATSNVHYPWWGVTKEILTEQGSHFEGNVSLCSCASEVWRSKWWVHCLMAKLECGLLLNTFAPKGQVWIVQGVLWSPLVVNCTRDRYRQMLIENVIPAIKEKWPDRNRNISIQQDGASCAYNTRWFRIQEVCTARSLEH